MNIFCARNLGALVALLLLLVAPIVATGQVRSATVSGTVQDPTGRVVAGATVTVLEVSTSQTYRTTSNASGNFSIPYLPSGTYNVTIAEKGFDTTSQTGIAVGTGDSIHLDIALRVGTSTETVEVSTESTGIQVDSPVVQSSISEEVIASIPNMNHNALAYAQLQAGVNTRALGASATNANSFGIGISGRRQISDFAINGGQAYENDIQLDGLSTQSPGFNEVTVVINTDAVSEVRAMVNDYSAQYGRAHGIIAETTRGGTDKLHGLVFMRNRSSALAANFFSNNHVTPQIPKSASEIWTYGGTVGGPIKRGKAFYFGSFEGLYYDQPKTLLRTIPTAAERIGDFSQTKVSVSGVPTALSLYDPFNVTPSGSNVYSRALIAGANTNNSVKGTNQFALNVLKNYPCAPTTVVNGVTLPACTNRPASDLFDTNNYQSNIVTSYRKANVNARIDYHIRNNNYLYISGGYTHGDIINPLIWSPDNLFNPVVNSGEERFNRDRNPYVSIGDTILLSPTLVVDLRYSISRIDTQDNSDLVPSGFDYSSLGISAIDQANNPLAVVPSFTVSGATTGDNWTAVNNNSYYNKHEHQTDHVVAGSVTKNHGKWNYKAGGELRAYLANYTDSQTSFIYTLSNTFTVPTVNAGGGVVGSNLANNGGNPWASFLLGAGSVGIPAGQTVHPAFLHQYAAIYTQNDWHPTDKLTINVGARWDWQPAISERYGNVSSIDLTATNPFGGKGGIYFPKANGNNKRMWDTDWLNFQPRLGIAYRASKDTVVRAGAGVAFLPSNSGYFDGPYLFGSTSFDPYTNSQPYGFGTQNGVPAGTFDSAAVNQYVPATGADTTAPGLYGGVGGPRFPAHGFKNSYIYQGNLHIQQDLRRGFTVDFGYNVEIGKRLQLGSSYTPNSDQLLPDSVLQSWRANYIARNGTGNTGSDQVANPFQPNPNALIPFAGNLGKKTMPLDQTLWAYPYLGGQVIQQNRGFSTYHALQVAVKKDFSRGLIFGSNFTWSRSLGVDGGTTENNFGAEGTGNSLPNLRDIRLDKRLSANDTPIRFSSYGVYNLPFGSGHSFNPKNRFVRGLVSGYRLSGTYIWQSGTPQQINCSTGSFDGKCDRNPGIPFVLPKSFQHFYDGVTTITLPNSGRPFTPAANTFLKWNPDAFKARTVVTANGSTQPDIYFYGNAALSYGDLRSDPVDNVTMSFEKDFKVRERYTLNFQANATNLLNHTQFQSGGYNGGLGAPNLTGNYIGTLNGNTYGAHGLGTLDPRLIELQARISF